MSRKKELDKLEADFYRTSKDVPTTNREYSKSHDDFKNKVLWMWRDGKGMTPEKIAFQLTKSTNTMLAGVRDSNYLTKPQFDPTNKAHVATLERVKQVIADVDN
jgi:hypothetical protein